MCRNFSGSQEVAQQGYPLTQVINPYRGVNENHATPLRSPSWNRFKASFGSTKSRQAFCALLQDKRLQTHAHEGGLLLDARDVGSPFQGLIIDIECCSHADT
jgi:hypothetical protein